ncbi:MAG: amino acid ABC transporter permease [Candidatus Nanopelagicales bacterium]|nr:amino acid ABC transporter permease [Candidatus Nanopelagicales bacterium]MCF8539003.1 amino acid ABC transporter permease [Candidatus Nanopelagicales bacterium]MCF8551019.1 amino acid ABC transporter permease [Candidatus Nanopelagicales bacterium]
MNVPAPGANVVYQDPLRQEQSRKKARRDALIGMASLIGFAVLSVFLVTRTSGWVAVQETFFNGDQFVESFPTLLEAFWLNVRIFLIAEPIILIVGLLVALARTLRAPIFLPLRVISTLYVDIFRGVPTILVIFLLGFGMPALQLQGVPSDAIFWGTAALILSYGAYVAEVFRAGIGSVHPSQTMAARSLGLSSFQTNRYVVLPQAVRNVMPPLLNDFISLQKDTALVAVLGPIEVLRRAQIDTSSNFNYTPYVGAALIFIALTIPMTRFADWIQKRSAKKRQAGGVTA